MFKLASDLSCFKTQRIGNGTFGAKTTELDKFKERCGKDRLEKAGFVIPPSVSLSIDLFMPALMRMGVCNQHGEFVPNPSAIASKWGVTKIFKLKKHPEAREIIEAAAQFTGHPIAIRSDERSAKGIGAFKTFMRGYFGNAPIKNGWENDEYNLLARIVDILCLQFDPVPMAFKEKVGMPHGIGVMLMPLVGDVVHSKESDLLYPKVSLSGFTAIEQNKIIVNFGYGLGGGVDQNAETFIRHKEHQISGGVNCQENITVFDLKRKITNVTVENVEELFEMGLIPDEAYEAAIRVGTRMLEIAKELGNDFYWEIQSIDFEADKWAITQISEHVWPKIEKPSGRELLTIGEKNHGIIIGSGIVSCTGITNGAILPGDWQRREISEFTSGVRKNALLIGPRIGGYLNGFLNVGIQMGLDTFPLYCNAGAIVDSPQDHGRPLRAHISGIYREAGIPILSPNTGIQNMQKAVTFDDVIKTARERNVPSSEYKGKLNEIKKELLRTTEFVVWTDELNQTGGVVAP